MPETPSGQTQKTEIGLSTNREIEHAVTNRTRITEDFLKENMPLPAWFASPDMVKSPYHGIDHMLRVVVLQEVITDRLLETGRIKPGEVDREALRWAARVHDTQRVSDIVDKEHAEKAVELLRQILPPEMSQQTREKIYRLVQLHDEDISGMEDVPIELAILKDADALDRIRLIKKLPRITPQGVIKRIGLDPDRLRFDESRELIPFAESLFAESTKDEERRVDDPVGAVMEATNSLLSEIGTKLSEPEVKPVQDLTTSAALKEPSSELLALFEQYEPQIHELYSQVDQWHGTGRYSIVYEDEDRTQVKEVQDVLEHICDSGLEPQPDNFDKLRGRGTSSVSTTSSRPYAMMYAAVHNGGVLKYRFHDSKFWARVTAIGAIKKFPGIVLDEYRTNGLAGIKETYPTIYRKNKWKDMKNWKKKADPAILPGDYPILIGMREGAFDPVRMSMLIRAYHEQRAHQPIPIDKLTHLEVPLGNMEETRKVLATKGITVPLIPIEMGEIYSSKFKPIDLVNGNPFRT